MGVVKDERFRKSELWFFGWFDTVKFPFLVAFPKQSQTTSIVDHLKQT